MKIVHRRGEEDIAEAYLAKVDTDRYVEFVDSVGGAGSRDEKWVIIVSTLYGCPVKCKFCDAGRFYDGKVSKDDMIAQIDHVLEKNSNSREIDSKKFKIQFARIGEPAFNDEVIDTILEIENEYEPENFMPCISTIAPSGRNRWFEDIAELNHGIFEGDFQMQFSIHSTDEKYRDELMPVEKWSLEKIAEYGENFYSGGRKVTLNFAIGGEERIDVEKLESIFDPRYFAVKITPINPTARAEENDLINVFDEENGRELDKVSELEDSTFDVYLSIGDLRENRIKSNCGQILMSYLDSEEFEAVDI